VGVARNSQGGGGGDRINRFHGFMKGDRERKDWTRGSGGGGTGKPIRKDNPWFQTMIELRDRGSVVIQKERGHERGGGNRREVPSESNKKERWKNVRWARSKTGTCLVPGLGGEKNKLSISGKDQKTNVSKKKRLAEAKENATYRPFLFGTRWGVGETSINNRPEPTAWAENIYIGKKSQEERCRWEPELPREKWTPTSDKGPKIKNAAGFQASRQ